MQIRVGYELIYECPQPTPMILALNIHFTRVSDLVTADGSCALVTHRPARARWPLPVDRAGSEVASDGEPGAGDAEEDTDHPDGEQGIGAHDGEGEVAAIERG